jgi:signal transduction histidine kinase/DNA-binding NarL/FixJ family response regulator
VATVLIVDDRPVNRDLVRTVLGYHGHVTVEADGGPEALQILRDAPPDIVVADVLMPGMDGYQLARAIRADPVTNAIPVLFYTANYVEEEIRPIATAVGVDRIVAKSGDLTELIQAIDDTLGTTPMPTEPIAPAEFDREHLRILNAKLIEKVEELEEAARFNQMVDAIVAVGDDLRLPAMLRRIVAAAHSLVGARHTSLVTAGAEGCALECVQGDGAQASVQSAEVLAAAHPDELAALGYLVVPIRIDGEIFGNLLLLESSRTGFTQTDRRLLETLARAAGVAIANSQLYNDARRKQAWLAASVDVASTLLVSDADSALQLIGSGARRVIGAKLSWIEVANGDRVTIQACDGPLSSVLITQSIPLSQAVLFADICATGQPVVVDDAASDERLSAALPCAAMEIGALLGVPLIASGRSFGVLFVGNERGGPLFSALDVEMARAFAARSAMTMEFARSEGDRQRLTLLEDRNRIARDLHDVVIQRLFGLGLRLERVRAQVPDQSAVQIADISGDLDQTIDEIRNTIFSLSSSIDDRPSLRGEVIRIVESTRFVLTFAPQLRIDGPIDHAVPDYIQPHLLATLSEALSNIVRHAAAAQVEVLVRSSEDELILRVTDDGRGLPKYRAESGLANLRRRASDLGGTMDLKPGPDRHGTALTWRIPLAAASDRAYADTAQ